MVRRIIKWGFVFSALVFLILFFMDKERCKQALQTLLGDFGGWTQVFAVISPLFIAGLLQYGRKGLRSVKELTKSRIFTEVFAGWLGFWFLVFIVRYAWPVEDAKWNQPIINGSAVLELRVRNTGDDYSVSAFSTVPAVMAFVETNVAHLIFRSPNTSIRRISDEEIIYSADLNSSSDSGNTSLSTLTNLPLIAFQIGAFYDDTEISGGTVSLTVNSTSFRYEFPKMQLPKTPGGPTFLIPNKPLNPMSE